MLKLAVLGCVLGLVVGQEQWMKIEPPADAGCCTPAQWEGGAGIVTGMSGILFRGKLLTEGVRLSYDYKNKRLAENVYFRVRNSTVNVGLIFDFSKKIAYRFFPKYKKCRSQAVKSSFKPFCTPAGARKLGDFYFGAGASKLQATSYAFRMPKLGFGGSVTVTSKGCIPIGEEIIGRRRTVKYLSNIGFANITPGIKDPKVFNPPSYCSSDNTPEFYEDSGYEELDDFLVSYMHARLME